LEGLVPAESILLKPIKSIPRKFTTNISRLTQPSPSIQNEDQQYQVRLLSTLLLVFLLLGITSVTYQSITVPDFRKILPVLVAVLLLLAIAYFLSRTRYFEISRFLIIFCPTIAVLFNAASDPAPEIALLYLLISILLSSILWPWLQTLIVVAINIGLAFSLPFFVPGLTIEGMASSLSLLSIISGLILVSIRYRNALENNRQNALVTSEKRYRLLIKQSPLATIVYDPSGRPRMYNQAAINLWNLSPQDLAYIKKNFNILEDEQLNALGISEIIKRGFSGEAVLTPPSKYEYTRHDENGREIVEDRWIVSHIYPIKDENQAIIEVVLLQEDITERKRAETAIENHNRELAALNRAISAANATLQIEEILQYVCLELTVIMDASFSIAALLDDEATEAAIVTAVQPAGSANIRGMTISLDPFINSPLARKVLLDKEPVIIANARQSPELKAAQPVLAQQNIASLIIIPLVVRDKIIGIVGVGCDIQREFDNALVDLAHSVVSSISPAIHNAHLHEKAMLHATTLEERIQARTHELAAANKRLQKLANLKDEFVSNVSHELRTPIANIKLYHDLLSLNSENLDSYTGTLKRETDRLEHIVESLLQLSRLDQGTNLMQSASVDLNAVAELFVADHCTQAQQTGIHLSFAGDAVLPKVRCDVRQIGQVLSILVTNAINYTPEGGSVEVSTKAVQEDGRLWGTLWVQDSGPGVSSGDKQYLFDRFFRGEVGRASAHPGTGLGLAIAKKIIDQHNGRIEVSQSKIAESGAAFIVWLPISKK
jgi:PAS domain S-box-containing protein